MSEYGDPSFLRVEFNPLAVDKSNQKQTLVGLLLRMWRVHLLPHLLYHVRGRSDSPTPQR
jgi:hypothetical protein